MSRAACSHGGQINCRDLTPYLTYICWCSLSIFLQIKVCLPLTDSTFCSSCYCWKLFTKFLFSDFLSIFLWLLAPLCQSSCCCMLASLRYLIFLIPILLALLHIFLILYWYNYSIISICYYCWHVRPSPCYCWCINIEKYCITLQFVEKKCGIIFRELDFQKRNILYKKYESSTGVGVAA